MTEPKTSPEKFDLPQKDHLLLAIVGKKALHKTKREIMIEKAKKAKEQIFS